jgi:hypothetical protein
MCVPLGNELVSPADFSRGFRRNDRRNRTAALSDQQSRSGSNALQVTAQVRF